VVHPPQAVPPALQGLGLHDRVCSGGQVGPLPGQLADRVTTPAVQLAARQVNVSSWYPLGGQLGLLPEQTSCTSHPPAAAGRQTVPVPAKPSVGQVLPPLHVSATSHPPLVAVRQTVPLATLASAGQAALPPLHVSGRSQSPAALRHVVPLRKPSTGHEVDDPLQVSTASQTPAEPRHWVPAGAACTKLHAPLTHRSLLQGLPSLQPAQAAPAMPHWPAVWLAGATHTLPVQHPVQQAPDRHWPGAPVGDAHWVPPCALAWPHVPSTLQVSTVQGLPSSQLWQVLPFTPQAAALDPTQLCPFQQLPAAQQLPLRHWPVPPPQRVPSGRGAFAHAPVEQLSVVHSLASLHETQALPLAPQASGLFPASHELPVQQPAQQLPLRHRPPTQGLPSGAGVLAQSPPPQDSLVHWLLSSHDPQIAPPVPHSAGVSPGWQLLPSQQPAQQMPE